MGIALFYPRVPGTHGYCAALGEKGIYMSLTPLQERRERVFLVLAAIFWGSMTLLNVIGITKFIHIGPLALAVGVLPYPLTFCVRI